MKEPWTEARSYEALVRTARRVLRRVSLPDLDPEDLVNSAWVDASTQAPVPITAYRYLARWMWGYAWRLVDQRTRYKVLSLTDTDVASGGTEPLAITRVSLLEVVNAMGNDPAIALLILNGLGDTFDTLSERCGVDARALKQQAMHARHRLLGIRPARSRVFRAGYRVHYVSPFGG